MFPSFWGTKKPRGKEIFLRPSGKRLHNYGNSPFLMGRSTNSMAIFNSELLVHQRMVTWRSSKSPAHHVDPFQSWLTRWSSGCGKEISRAQRYSSPTSPASSRIISTGILNMKAQKERIQQQGSDMLELLYMRYVSFLTSRILKSESDRSLLTKCTIANSSGWSHYFYVVFSHLSLPTADISTTMNLNQPIWFQICGCRCIIGSSTHDSTHCLTT